jgi:hypothetical protein
LRRGLEHLKIETGLIDERFESVMGECGKYRSDKQNSALPANKSFFFFADDTQASFYDTNTPTWALLSWPSAQTAPTKKLKKFPTTNDTHFVLYLLFTSHYCSQPHALLALFS